jgi:hypothetical protein
MASIRAEVKTFFNVSAAFVRREAKSLRRRSSPVFTSIISPVSASRKTKYPSPGSSIS